MLASIIYYKHKHVLISYSRPFEQSLALIDNWLIHTCIDLVAGKKKKWIKFIIIFYAIENDAVLEWLCLCRMPDFKIKAVSIIIPRSLNAFFIHAKEFKVKVINCVLFELDRIKTRFKLNNRWVLNQIQLGLLSNSRTELQYIERTYT